MNSLQMVVTDDVQVDAGMRGDFDLHHDELSLLMTAGGMRAAREAEGSLADRMITRLRMPVLDGFHFLSYLMDQRFNLPIFLSNAPGSAQCQHYVLAPGREGLRAPFSSRGAPASAESHAPRAPAQTMRHGVTLLEFLRFCVDERQTRVLEVSSGERTAELHLTFGKLIHARCGEHEGLPVFFEVMGWKAPCLRILPRLPGLRTSITTAMPSLLGMPLEERLAMDSIA